jgi:tetratricopeptide (TPR) repeat protein
MLLCLLYVIPALLIEPGPGYSSDFISQQAYSLRMNGKADSAKGLLEGSINSDSTNAVVWYEYARTKLHIGLGNPRELFTGLEKLQYAIKKATAIQPGNVIYSYYDGYICFLQAYVSLKRDPTHAPEYIKEVISVYEAVLKLSPGHQQTLLYLTEVLSLPANMGGDSLKADMYAGQLEKIDAVNGAKAREMRLPENADRVKYWLDVLSKNPGNAEILELLGKAYLYQGNLEQGERYIEEALVKNPQKTSLLLDFARFYVMKSWQDTSHAKVLLPQADILISRYLKSSPIIPLAAFALNMQAGIKQRLGFKEDANVLQIKANALDPNVSKAFAIPPGLLFNKPDEMSQYHGYFFRPI